MPQLNYKAMNIARAEREHNANFFTTLQSLGEGTPSINDLLFVLQAGGLTEDEAGDLIDDKGMTVAITNSVEALTDAGFLGNSAEAQEAKQAAKQIVTKASDNTGQSKKPSVSKSASTSNSTGNSTRPSSNEPSAATATEQKPKPSNKTN